MIHAPDHMVFVILAVLFPIRAVTFGFRRLEAAGPAEVPRVRLWLYRQIMILQASLSALVVWLWVVFRRPWGDLGLEPRATWGLAGVALGVLIVIPLVVLQHLRARGDPETAARVRQRFARLERMLPHDRRELRWFSAVGITAGVCEELLYRGFVLWYLGHWLAIGPAVAGSAIVFGIGHFYQGPRGMVTTALVGAFMAAVYLVSGSLLAPMVIHALMDLYSGWATYEAFRAPAPAADPPAGA
ncbi:MAG TPA: type II CAAX endopeptidase family protein [Candidatus Eisenbacteria bacterium]